MTQEYTIKEKFDWNIYALEENLNTLKKDLKIDQSQLNIVENRNKKIYKNLSCVLHWIVYTDTYLYENSKSKKSDLYTLRKKKAGISNELHGIRYLYNYLKHQTTTFKVSKVDVTAVFDRPLFPDGYEIPVKFSSKMNENQKNRIQQTFELYVAHIQNQDIQDWVDKVLSFYKNIDISEIL